MSEIGTYCQRIKDLNKQVSDFVRDIPVDGLNWRPPYENVNSLAVLASHIAGAQRFWILEVIGKQTATRDRAEEFKTIVSNGDELSATLSRTFGEVDDTLASLSATDPGEIRQADGKDVPIRWGIIHIIDHTALHFGQMQLMYQLWSNGKSKPSPLWDQRLTLP